MASLFDMENSSDSEDDFDYEPAAEELSSEDEEPIPISDDEKDSKQKPRKIRTQKGSKAVLDSEQKGSSDESKQVSDTVDDKKKADDVYKSFLDEVAAEMKCGSSGISNASGGSLTSSPVVLSSETSSPLFSQSSGISTCGEKLFEFAGETVSVVDGTVKSVERDSDSASISHSKIEKSASDAVASAPPPVKRRGLESVLGTIQSKKQKITVLQKSLIDWRSFKKEEGIEGEMEKFNRGKGGYIERRRFLERSDVRSYEIERDMRLSKRSTQAKRDT